MSKGERIAGIATLAIVTLVVVLLLSGITSAIGSISGKSTHRAVQPVVSYKNVEETEVIPFEKISQDDPTRDIGMETITTFGVDGLHTRTYQVKYEDGKEVGRTLAKDEITTQPVTEVTSIGTRTPYTPPTQQLSAGSCDPNYTGCVPVDSDVDCGGGSGNGPSYVYGVVEVIGRLRT